MDRTLERLEVTTMPGKRFFATKAEMEAGIRAFESNWQVKYVRTGLRPSIGADVQQ
jgi:hypothetical protein